MQIVLKSLIFFFLTCSSVLPDDLEDVAEDYIDGIEDNLEVKKWKKQLKEFQYQLEEQKKIFYLNPSQGIDQVPHSEIVSLEEKAKGIRPLIKPILISAAKLSTDSILAHSLKISSDNRDKDDVVIWLRKKEQVRSINLDILGKAMAKLVKEFERFETDWIQFYSRRVFFKAINDRFENFEYNQDMVACHKAEEIVRVYKLAIKHNPGRALKKFKIVYKAVTKRVTRLKEFQSRLSEDNLSNSVIEMAKLGNININAVHEKKIQEAIKILAQPNTKAVENRINRWIKLKKEIIVGGKAAKFAMDRKAVKKEYFDNLENQLSTIAQKKDKDVSLNQETELALNKKSDKVKTTNVTSGRNKLEVFVDEFADSLGDVDDSLLTVEMKRQDFKQLYGDGIKETNSAYVFQAQGRADKTDLRKFVHEVSLMSFGSFTTFLSYGLPKNWRPSRRVKWIALKEVDEKDYNREFSYVDLFTEAHRKGTKYQVILEHNEYLPANMILIFNSKGRVIRYQSFASIYDLKVRKKDVTRGHLYYKFLHYSVRGDKILLNGIDNQVKVSRLNR